MKKNVRCAVIGQHPLRFPWGFDEEDDGCRRMKLEMAQRIMELRQRGVTEFQVACDPGVGLYTAEIINILREKDKPFGWSASYPMRSRLPDVAASGALLQYARGMHGTGLHRLP